MTGTTLPATTSIERPGLLAALGTYLELSKPRISILVLLTTLVGFLIATTGALDVGRLLITLLGTGLAAAGGNALNQLLEQGPDSRMQRTRMRPLPEGRLTRTEVGTFGVVVSIAGTLLLALTVNLLTAGLAAFTVVAYAFIYTPLKRRTPLCTLIGAVPGAVPPVLGVTAVTGVIGMEAWWLFAILLFWQLPHFYAIAWIYRDDYAYGGFPMLPVIDRCGTRTAVESLGYLALMFAASLGPYLDGSAGRVYLVTAITLGLLFGATVYRFVRSKSLRSARVVFITSIIYLPVLYITLVADWL